MEGLCGIFCTRLSRKTNKRKTAASIIDSDDRTHEGVRTVDTGNCCEFSGHSDVCLCIVTWNMNGQVSSEDINKLVGKNRKLDLLVIGLQEVPRENIAQLLKNVLADTHILLGEAIMQSLQLFVFGPKHSQQFVRGIKVDKQPVGGLGGLIGRKKGAVAIRIKYKGIQMLFVSCHLAAHVGNVEERNDQFRHISRSIFSKDWNPNATPAQLTVWLGDFNYRLEGINTFPARDLIHENLHELLTSKDQLLQEAERGQIFNGFREGTLSFKPTYKYNIGSSNYDTSYKVRVPAWTDRILFKIGDHDHIRATLHCYDSMDTISSSDHKPVKAHICLSVNRQSSHPRMEQ
ncbi:type IV inositol polyphosphate 5-phosphatase 11-like [Coffea arabica]|uniref:Type IV inositol polyphosphate 5-phosphatase 11-like n=1 Tax=Coffea arabica TaxID=13443 RepID=A0A6P6UK36_COFAR|nr:type IV inositol polyphosphate 5-phosphatase 11-like [Coffea arabica]